MLTDTEASRLAEALGRQAIADACGVGLTAVSNAVVRGEFPSSWFLAMKVLAAKSNVECPPRLFKMRHVGLPRNVDLSVVVQDAAAKKSRKGGCPNG